ncbi:hypothetical protein BJX64DRAFT_271823 [Aspergillus heterothallicus]
MSSTESLPLPLDDADVNPTFTAAPPPQPSPAVSTIEELCAKLADKEDGFELADEFWENNKGQLDQPRQNRTALSLAVENLTESTRYIAWELLEHGANSNVKVSKGRTALSHAAEDVDEWLARQLIEKGATVDEEDNDGRTAFSWVANSKQPPGLKSFHSGTDDMWKHYMTKELTKKRLALLKEHHADIQKPDNSGRTPLSWAAATGNEIMVRFICENTSRGDDYFKADNLGRSPLSYAAEEQHHDIIKYLVEHQKHHKKHHKDVDNNYRTPLHWLYQTDNVGYRKQDRNNETTSLILEFLGFGRRESAWGFSSPIVSDPAILNRSVKCGKTLLSYAVLNDDESLVSVLCDRVKGLSSNEENLDDKETALMIALRRDNDDGKSYIVQKLLDHAELKGALRRIFEQGECESLKKLLKYPCQAGKEDNTKEYNTAECALKRTFLDSFFKYAAPDAAAPLLRAILESRPLALDPNEDLAHGKSLLQETRNWEHTSKELSSVLLEHGANPKIWTKAEDWNWWPRLSDQCLLRLEKRQRGVASSYNFSRATNEDLGQAAVEDDTTVFISHEEVGSWKSVSSLKGLHDSSVRENEIQLDAVGSLKPCSDVYHFNIPSWGVRWIENKSGKPLLYESTLRKVWIPENLQDFLTEFLQEFADKWEGYCDETENHLNKHRETAFEDATNESRTKSLGLDIYYLSKLRGALQSQVRVIQHGLSKAFRNSSTELKDLRDILKEHKIYYNERFDRLDQTVHILLQLEYTRHSIREAQAIRLVSFIAFIYLPLMFTSSLFGMNVNILRDNPAWYWYLPFAAVSVGVTVSTYLIYQDFEEQIRVNGKRKWPFPWRNESPAIGETNV